MSKIEYCKQHNIKYSWFMNYFSSTRQKQGFEQVEISTQLKAIDGEIKLCYPDGRYFVFNAGVSVALLKELLR